MKTQIYLEEIMTNLAKNTKNPCVILCDRGLMDPLAYCKGEIYDKICKPLRFTHGY